MSNNPFDDSDNEGEIREGFLCPSCRLDLKSVEFLVEHVENEHAEERDAFQSAFKEFFIKAKKKLKVNFEESRSSSSNERETKNPKAQPSSCINSLNAMDKYQTVGLEKSHLESFNEERNPRLERYASEANKLIIRLNKILTNRPGDPVQRRNHEKSIVQWIDGSLVKLCPSCAKSFHLARRQHHCRLCGSVMCADCSKYFAITDAIELAHTTSAQLEEKDKLSEKDDMENDIRCCDHCLHLLESRKEMHDSRTCRPPITLLYSNIQELKKEIFPDIEMYLKIRNSLCEGESIFKLSDASALRGKIGRMAELIDLNSKKILALPSVDGSREHALKKYIRLACVQFIKEEMLSIPPLPVEEEIQRIQEIRRQETAKKIENERQMALKAFEKYGLAESCPSRASNGETSSVSSVKSLDNWSVHQDSTIKGNDDILVEQMNIIKNYIKQAREAMRFDEVETLEINLRELQNEFYSKNL